MRATAMLCLLFLLAASEARYNYMDTSTALKFNLKACTVASSNREWTQIELGVEGGRAPYDYFYDEYPEDWKFANQHIYVPTGSLARNMKVPCRVRVVDRMGNQARAAIVFVVMDQGISVSPTLLPYDRVFDDSFFYSNGCRDRPRLIRASSYTSWMDYSFMYGSRYDYVYDSYYRNGLINKVLVPGKSTPSPQPIIPSVKVNTSMVTNTSKPAATTNASISPNSSAASPNTTVGNTSNPSTPAISFINSNSTAIKSERTNTTTGASTQVPAAPTSQPAAPKTSISSSQPQPSIPIIVLPSGQASTGTAATPKPSTIPTPTANPQPLNQTDTVKVVNSSGQIPVVQLNPSPQPPAATNTPASPVPVPTGLPITSIPLGSTPTPTPTPSLPVPVPMPGTPMIVSAPQFNPIFTKLPNSTQIDSLIVTADTLNLTKLVDDVNSAANLTCEQKASYLSDFLGRIQSAIAMKTYAAEQLQQAINAANVSYSNLVFQIGQIKDEQKNLTTEVIRNKLKIDLSTIESLYAQFNDLDTSTAPLEAEIEGLKKEIAVLNAKSDIDRQEVVRQKLSYNEADAMVKKIQDLMAVVKTRKTELESKISNMEAGIANSDAQVKSSLANISNTEAEIKNLESVVDSQKYIYGNLEATVTKYRALIARAAKKEDELLPQIANLEARLRMEKQKMASGELDKLKEMVAGLGSSLPGIQKFIDDNYYRCFRANSLPGSQNGSALVYIVGTADFERYIERAYQLKPDWSKVSFLAPTLKLSPLNILDSMWQSAYGAPYDLVSFAATTDFSFKDDFNCLAPSSLESGFGMIAGIGGRFLLVDNLQGGTLRLNLGTCTRLETAQLLPSIGQRVYWRGNPAGRAGEFNAYRASCV